MDKISNSILTKVLILILDKLVSFNVWGISQISNPFLVILEIVNDTPFIKIEAFSIRSFLYFLLTSNSITLELPLLKIFITLRYFNNKSVFKNLKIFSTPSKINFLNTKDLAKVTNKKFILFLSTSQGLLTNIECKKKNIGGKLLFTL